MKIEKESWLQKHYFIKTLLQTAITFSFSILTFVLDEINYYNDNKKVHSLFIFILSLVIIGSTIGFFLKYKADHKNYLKKVNNFQFLNIVKDHAISILATVVPQKGKNSSYCDTIDKISILSRECIKKLYDIPNENITIDLIIKSNSIWKYLYSLNEEISTTELDPNIFNDDMIKRMKDNLGYLFESVDGDISTKIGSKYYGLIMINNEPVILILTTFYNQICSNDDDQSQKIFHNFVMKPGLDAIKSKLMRSKICL